MNDTLKRFVEQMVRQIAASLGSMYVRPAPIEAAHRLIFPEKRQGEIRVSEQESKILLCRYLENSEYLYSVETPTVETYMQQGETPLSARTDIAVWDAGGGELRRVLNIELKAHNCTEEQTRKDLEKLIREKIDGIWFHTLERADRATFRSLFSKFIRSFQKLRMQYKDSDQAYLFAFCTLDPNALLTRWVSFNGHEAHNAREIDNAFGGSESRAFAGWNIVNLKTGEVSPDIFPRTGPATAHLGSLRGRGARAGSLILAPEINPRSFLHLSTRGSSYFIRDYSETGPDRPPRKFRWVGCSKVEELQRMVRVLKELEPTADDMKMNIDKRPDYWYRRILALNKAYLP